MSAIEIDNTTQTDWMYATAVQDLSNMNYKAQITLNHALAAVKIVLKKGAYDGAGNVTAVTVSSEGFAQTAMLNAKTGELSGFGETNTAMSLSEESFTLNEEGRELVAIVIPTGEAEPIKIKTTIDGNEYEAQTNAISLESGTITSYETKSTTNDLKITKISVVTEWTSDEQGSVELQGAATDLTAATNGETANCYIISKAGDYSFPTVKGNSSESVGAVASAKVVWESYGTTETINIGDLVSEAVYEDGKIKVTTTGKNGNAVVAACDASGNILWSWHLWMTDETIQEHTYANGAGVAMDRNLGALSATPGDVGALGLLYQWGRKDPFLASASISASTEPAVAGTAICENTCNTLALTIANPTYIDLYDAADDSWGGTKTIYDPCPVGWKVPGKNFWTNAGIINTPSNEYWDATNKGMLLPASISGAQSWYPAAGFRENVGTLCDGGRNGDYWSSASSGSDDTYFMYFIPDMISPGSLNFTYYGCSVRAVRE